MDEQTATQEMSLEESYTHEKAYFEQLVTSDEITRQDVIEAWHVYQDLTSLYFELHLRELGTTGMFEPLDAARYAEDAVNVLEGNATNLSEQEQAKAKDAFIFNTLGLVSVTTPNGEFLSKLPAEKTDQAKKFLAAMYYVVYVEPEQKNTKGLPEKISA